MKRIIPSLFFLFSTIGLMSQTDVYTPTLKSPADSATNMVPNITVSWNAVAGSTNLQYQIQLDTTLNFNSSLLVDTTQILLTGYTAHELLFGQRYYWRVRAIDQGETSYWTAIRNFVVFNQVSLSKPASNMIDQNPNVSLIWLNTVNQNGTNVTITGIQFYDYQYDSVETFDSPFLKEGSTSPDVVTTATSNLMFGKKYYYRVRARHNLDTSPWCTPWGFFVVDKITLEKPLDLAQGQMINATLQWKKLTGIIGYEYQLARDQSFNDVIIQTDVDTNFTSSSLLQFGEKVYWRVRARQLHDTSSWSNTRSFTVINTVILETPKDLSTDIDVKPALYWTKQTGLAGFELQVDTLTTFIDPVIQVNPGATDVNYKVTKKLANLKTYYWRMRAFSDGGETADTSNWSAPWSFITIGPQGLEESGSFSFSIYPNPANEKIAIKAIVSESKVIQVSLVDIIGKTLLTSEVRLSSGSNIKEIPLSDINKGVYILRIFSDGQTINRKVIVDR